MFKLMLIFSFMYIGTTLLAARLSCESCGSECAPACGTRRFRSCCFNYLRKKRAEVQLWSSNNVDGRHENSGKSNLPHFQRTSIVENIPEQMIPHLFADEYDSYIFDYANNRIEA